jgi:hypothetical protein
MPAEKGSLFLVTIRSGWFGLEHRTFVATMDMVSSIIVADMDSRGKNLEFELDGVQIISVKIKN